VYLVAIKYLEAPVVQRRRKILENTETNSRVAKVKALGLLPGSRSYKCEVQGVPGTFKLSSKALAYVGGCRRQTVGA
jgi:hypothetical protein